MAGRPCSPRLSASPRALLSPHPLSPGCCSCCEPHTRHHLPLARAPASRRPLPLPPMAPPLPPSAACLAPCSASTLAARPAVLPAPLHPAGDHLPARAMPPLPVIRNHLAGRSASLFRAPPSPLRCPRLLLAVGCHQPQARSSSFLLGPSSPARRPKTSRPVPSFPCCFSFFFLKLLPDVWALLIIASVSLLCAAVRLSSLRVESSRCCVHVLLLPHFVESPRTPETEP
ncbi:hypothetical protein BRADI_5g00297v3 [Brachypodium distachyon]|uniref:Uncharacterized protein n=1 Tax=Brachypodium distachyon TaxID=15368 RepID=A0A0Q3GKQ7_BRADI|nr:hypothetical protein BRADI_5g00297v3 [Brachypodium distachyon]KQJ81386.1 hypothetical protein BRADI_5g00297v3 [Brachypodium distachyon]PNT60473.1 hypothetical protein BRADI_5g00297v3 [Brachypodium distachyon]PNT60474.1 hypothetical protein BRADI_5g00297v3 [Brachypodium distachyon]